MRNDLDITDGSTRNDGGHIRSLSGGHRCMRNEYDGAADDIVALAEASDSSADDIVSSEMEFNVLEKVFEGLEMGLRSPETQYQTERIGKKYAQYNEPHKKGLYIWR